MKKIVCLFMVCNLFFATVFADNSKSSVVIDGDTLEILYQNNENEVLSMASTTKIMTAIIALENADLNREVEIKREYTLVEGSSMYLSEGEILYFEDLLYGLMLMSGNDSAIAIAHETTGDYDEFIELMNQKAVELGLENTSFENPNGLDGENHYTTAYELAVISAYALKNEKFCEITSSQYYTMENRTMKNHNKMLWLLEDSIGVKTGYTKKSGRCLVSASEINGKDIICVTLDCSDDWNVHETLIENAKNKYNTYNIAKKDEVLTVVPVFGGDSEKVGILFEQDANITMSDTQREKLCYEIIAPKNIYAPINEGDVYGEIIYKVDEKEVYRGFLLYNDTISYEFVEEMNIFMKFLTYIKELMY